MHGFCGSPHSGNTLAAVLKLQVLHDSMAERLVRAAQCGVQLVVPSSALVKATRDVAAPTPNQFCGYWQKHSGGLEKRVRFCHLNC